MGEEGGESLLGHDNIGNYGSEGCVLDRERMSS